jgi:hypothetical protein
MHRKLLFLFLNLLCFNITIAVAQFYNGHQMDFGKNRVQYNNFYWSLFKNEKFDTYFYQEGEVIARFVNEYAYNEILKIEQLLNYELKEKLILVVFNKFSDFKQSNIGLITGKNQYNTGGVTKINRNKISLFYQGNHLEFERQIRETIAEAIIIEMLLGSKLSENISSSILLYLPEWYIKGLSSFIAENWSPEIESKVKDGIYTGGFSKINQLKGDKAAIAGHSIWKYIHDYYGGTVIPDILFITRINKGVNRSLSAVLGLSTKELTKQYTAYYKEYFADEKMVFSGSINTSPNIIVNPKKSRYYNQFKINPSGDYIAYVSNDLGLFKVWIYNTRNGKTRKVYQSGNKIKQLTDYTYPVIEWHPWGKYLTIITEHENRLQIIQYSLLDKVLSFRNLFSFDKILDFSYSIDGSKMVLSGVRNGFTDVFVYDVASSTSEQITNDIADDFNPRFINGDNDILFSSNRINDNLKDKINQSQYLNHTDLYIYNYKEKNSILSNLSNSTYVNEIMPFEVKSNSYIYLGDKNGIRNLYYGYFDSTISFIDTSIHYRYFLNEKALTNRSGNIIEHNLNRNKEDYLELTFKDELFNAGLEQKVNFEKKAEQNLGLTKYRTKLEEKYMKEEKESYIESVQSIPDSSVIFSEENNYVDINRYLFEIEKPYFPIKYKNIAVDTTIAEKKSPKIQIYQRTFFTDELVSQVDFSFLNSSYQAFTGGAVYFNPGLNGLIKFGATDLLEDYKIVAGIRLSLDLKSNEYLVSFENLKKKIDEQIVFHRQSFENTTSAFTSKTISHKLVYLRNVPFSQVAALNGSITARYDKLTYLSTDRNTLQEPDIQKVWGGLKVEYIFDNTINTGVNLYNGTRYKIFAEYYKQINKSESDLFVIGGDFRNYIKIHRDLIFASRLAASTSFGYNKLIYYLGGVDSWTNFSGTTPTFVPLNEIPINENENYAFQAAATNMRGFPQNIRNGNSFALVNTELRWPFVKYFSSHPIGSSFWNNLQLVGFFDVGTAWSGSSPWSDENAYSKKVIYNKPITITIDTGRDPIVAGYGAGLRVMFLGYFVRFDWAWGIENMEVLPRVFYFSLSLDF